MSDIFPPVKQTLERLMNSIICDKCLLSAQYELFEKNSFIVGNELLRENFDNAALSGVHTTVPQSGRAAGLMPA